MKIGRNTPCPCGSGKKYKPKLSDYGLDRQRAPRIRVKEPKNGPDSRFNHPDPDVEDNLSGDRVWFD